MSLHIHVILVPYFLMQYVSLIDLIFYNARKWVL